MSGTAKKITLIGFGVIGEAWAALFARAGYRVCVYTRANPSRNKHTMTTRLLETLKILEKQNLLGTNTIQHLLDQVTFTNDLATAVSGSFYVQENLPEKVDQKRQFYTELDPHLNDSISVGSSTSHLRPSTFTEQMKNKHRCLAAHPINPPFAVPVVEVVPSPWTSPDAVRTCQELMTAIGQKPIVLKTEIDGFVVNRLQFALLGEAYRLVANGVCTPREVDLAVNNGLALRWSFMGPFDTIRLNAPNGVMDYYERYGAGIQSNLRSQDNSVVLEKALFQEIEQDLKRDPLYEKKTKQWRDQNLLLLAKHKREVEALTSKL